jgi:hypothetical protein
MGNVLLRFDGWYTNPNNYRSSNMFTKTKLILATLILAATAQAHLIDLTPGGHMVSDGIPPAVLRFYLHQRFFDSAAHGWFNLPEGRTYLNGWVSRYGLLNGADWFGTNLFTQGDNAFASVSWNMAGQADGFWMTLILVEGRTDDGIAWENWYHVSPGQRFEGEGIVELNGDRLGTIVSIAFYGNRVPDTGATLLLFGLALATISCSMHLRVRSRQTTTTLGEDQWRTARN